MLYLLGLSGLLNINNFVLDKFWVSRNCKIMKMKLKFESMYLSLQPYNIQTCLYFCSSRKHNEA